MTDENRANLTWFLPAAAAGLIAQADEGRMAAVAAAVVVDRSLTTVEDCRSCWRTLVPRRSLPPTAGDSAARGATRCSYREDPACCRCSYRQPLQPRPLEDLA